jgi:hypothetical protein
MLPVLDVIQSAGGAYIAFYAGSPRTRATGMLPRPIGGLFWLLNGRRHKMRCRRHPRELPALLRAHSRKVAVSEPFAVYFSLQGTAVNRGGVFHDHGFAILVLALDGEAYVVPGDGTLQRRVTASSFQRPFNCAAVLMDRQGRGHGSILALGR